MKSIGYSISAILLTLAAVGQITMAILLYAPAGSDAVRNLGWVVLWTSALFGWLPIATMRRRGGVPRGKGYVHTRVLVDRGLYSVVRHPQYLAGILLAIALPLIALHWLVALPGIITVVTTARDAAEEERECLEKFGGEYARYMERVPRFNLLLGIARLLLHRGRV